MGDTQIVYDEKFGIATFKREICAELGEAFWNELVRGIELPDIDSECKCGCHNMYLFMNRLEAMAEAEAVKKILCRVRHGLHPSQCEWAHKEFLELGSLDAFLHKHWLSAFIWTGKTRSQNYRSLPRAYVREKFHGYGM